MADKSNKTDKIKRDVKKGLKKAEKAVEKAAVVAEDVAKKTISKLEGGAKKAIHKIEKAVENLAENKKKQEGKEQEHKHSEKIKFSDFGKIDMRVGIIKKADAHPDADKLLVLTVDLGKETRTIVAGLAQHYEPEELEGKKAIFVTNLEPIVLRGVKSEGMILAAVSNDKEKVVFLQPQKDIDAGTKVS